MNRLLSFSVAAIVVLLSCVSKHDSKPPILSDLPDEPSADVQIEEKDTIPPEITAILNAYRDCVVKYSDDSLFLSSGEAIPFDLSLKSDSYLRRLDSTTVKDMFYDVYPLGGLTEPPYLFDPGRYRNDELFKAMYGHSEEEALSRLEKVDVFGTEIQFSTVNGAADSLKSVISEITASYPDKVKYFSDPSSFNWRAVRGARRMSAHSYGIALDIGTKYSDYWLWSNSGASELDSLVYKNRIPEEMIHVFEKHGFISGARWYHYDTMHFEFRPELIYYSKMLESGEETHIITM